MWTLGERRSSRHLPCLANGGCEWAKWIFCDGCEAAAFLNDGELHWGEGRPAIICINNSCKVIEMRWRMGMNERH